MTTGERGARVDARGVLLVAALALVVSAPSITNGFAYDDRWIIVENPRVHELSRWYDWFTTSYWPTREGSLYRPLTTASFALQWAAGDGAPVVFHAVSILLYVAAAAAFTWLASLLLPATAALVAGALFAVHPVHVEATANVVGQSEMSAAAALFVALALYIGARRRGALGRRTTLGITALYLTAVLCKEHALILPAALVLCELTVLRAPGSLRERAGEVWRATGRLHVLLAAVAAFALVVRWDVLGALGGDIPHPALQGLGAWQRTLVMLDVVPELARLLVWPARLYADYSPAHMLVWTEPNVSQLNGLLFCVGVLVLVGVAWRRSPVAAFGLCFAAGAWLPTSNLLFPSGILLSERTLFLPSAGVLLAVGAAAVWVDGRTHGVRRARVALGVALASVLVLAAARSIDRARVWRSSVDVFHTMWRDQPESFKAHFAWGGVLFDRGDYAAGEREWLMAIRIFPEYHRLYQDLGHRYREARVCSAAIRMYRRAIELGGRLPLSRAGQIVCELELARFTDARHTALLGIADGNDPDWFRARLASADSALAAQDSVPTRVP